MNGAESLLRSLVASGVEVCFANPGTSEMHFVAALDKVEGMRPVLTLFEGVATGAADGYGRMAKKPACTLLHLGPGLANGLANLHNARRAGSPIVNIVGDHASSHLRYDAPLASDIAGFARPVSAWIRSSTSARTVGADGAQAVQASMEAPGQIATLILPADTAWEAADRAAQALPRPQPTAVAADAVAQVAELLQRGHSTAILIRGEALEERGLRAAGKIAARYGARVLCDTFAPRIQRGAGRVKVERLPYFAEQVVDFLAGTELLILVGAQPPVSFFAYPDKPSWLTPEACRVTVLAHAHEDGVGALEALSDAIGAQNLVPQLVTRQRFALSSEGPLTAPYIMQVVANHLPENAILADESLSCGFPYFHLTQAAAAHDYLTLPGGAIGSMMAVATGAAIACPDRKVVLLQGDGSAMYIMQALWTQARENLDVVTIVYANRGYKILDNELLRVGAAEHGHKARSLLDLSNPTLDWVKIANGMGVDAIRTETRAAFEAALIAALRQSGPTLIEAVL